MQTLTFSTDIKAQRERVWTMLWEDANYREWTTPFSPGSYAVSDWKEGSKVSFLSGSGDGMYSTIESVRPNEYISFRHLGVIKGGEEQPIDDETKKWSGCTENYTLTQEGNVTTVVVHVDIVDEHRKYFEETFPKALEKLKEMSEK